MRGSVLIDGKSAIGRIDSDFICVTLDWWPPEKCDYGTCSWDHASLLNIVSLFCKNPFSLCVCVCVSIHVCKYADMLYLNMWKCRLRGFFGPNLQAIGLKVAKSLVSLYIAFMVFVVLLSFYF